ncbi:kinase-like domain-containing protein [Chaetomium tenue]|uniref:Kinase-like domain-containing protein n=1 Tax=Chaetomium tenue TaxID=1854479 RepID=A0ACB7P0A7_9PEZI|nr:kinase-like domain-containing protein [Chaetomium globosum]
MSATPSEGSNERHEEGCFARTFERKYYHRGVAFIKRSLRPREFRTNQRGDLHIPRANGERIKNEADTLRYIREHTDIPVPTVYADFEDDGAYYLVVEYIEGVCMADLTEDQKEVVELELDGHLNTLGGLRSNRVGGPSGIVIPPYRVMRRTVTVMAACSRPAGFVTRTEKDSWNPRPSRKKRFVFCHNDLSQHNVIVDPDTLKVKAIVDWEYAGFYPGCFEMLFYQRKGPSVALPDEMDDSALLLTFRFSEPAGN